MVWDKVLVAQNNDEFDHTFETDGFFKQGKERASAQKQKISAEKGITLEEYMGNFVKPYGRKRWSASYYSNNIALLNNYIFPYLGHYELAAITIKI